MPYECSKCGKIYLTKDENNKFLLAHVKKCNAEIIRIPSHVYERNDCSKDVQELKEENSFLKMELKTTKMLLKNLTNRIANLESNGISMHPDNALNWNQRKETIKVDSEEYQNYGKVMKELKSIMENVGNIREILHPIDARETIEVPPIMDFSQVRVIQN